MQFIIDYLTSILVGSVVLVILLVSQTSARSSEVDQQLYQAARRHTLAFKLTLERDLFNLGYGVHPSVVPITEWTDSTFAFRRMMDSTGTAPITTVRYARRLHHTVAGPNGATVPVFEVVRTEDGVVSGGSTPAMTDYSLEMIARDGTRTTDPALAVGVRVAFAALYGGREKDVVSNRSWHRRTYYPDNIRPD